MIKIYSVRFGPQKTLLQALVEGFSVFYAIIYAILGLRLINPSYIDKVSKKINSKGNDYQDTIKYYSQK